MVRIAGLLLAALSTAGCSSSMAARDGSTGTGGGPFGPFDGSSGSEAGHPLGSPSLGAHGMSFYHFDTSTASSITTPVMNTQPSGSTIVVGIGRGANSLTAAPTDSVGNAPYRPIDTVIPHPYTKWPDSGTAVYSFPSARGGSNFTVSTTTGANDAGQYDEITLAAIEVIAGTRLQDKRWNEVLAPRALTSGSVTTTGPATLIAFWFGDGYPKTPQTATPDSGFTLIDSNAQERDSFVQCAVAVKNVSAAGTYSVTWTATPQQGAQMWLVAVQ